MVLALTIHFEDRSSSSLPFEVFTCKTIVKLELFGFLIEEVPEDAFLPSLKSIVLESVNFFSLHGCAFEKLLSACPVLEDLAIYDLNWEQWKWSRKVTSRSLKRLTIERSEFDGFDGTDFGSITFDTPSVTRLDYSDFVPGSYPSVNLDSLVEANLSLIVTVDHTWDFNYADENDHITSNPTNLFKGLKNVKIMNLLDQEILEMFYLFRGAIPVFQNLVHLSTVTISDHCWRGLLLLLNNSPNLETLTIEGTLHYDPIDCECLSGYSFLLLCPVKLRFAI
ncbi:hypothetical protein AALP_AA3G357300 [Arabis alpina]|uniref:F-box/LRR-repeat protein 15/At3g58940/PEG3-like LRR domain-containing protein n=1 Tax=Arabis alpina TaxID=50452 RepID=A0A087HDU9_ARAAL|nr:hypothetical protein AALP_AA3G357300 [Arabis alpina]